MKNFDDVLEQYEPMINANLRTLHIYREFELFRQAGRVALWQAWNRFDEEKGDFTPFAYRSIRGAMLDELKKESRFTEKVTQTEDDILYGYADEKQKEEDDPEEGWSDRIEEVLEQLNNNERHLIYWLFVEGLTQVECAKRAGVSVSGIKKRRERMLVKLRERLGGRISEKLKE